MYVLHHVGGLYIEGKLPNQDGDLYIEEGKLPNQDGDLYIEERKLPHQDNGIVTRFDTKGVVCLCASNVGTGYQGCLGYSDQGSLAVGVSASGALREAIPNDQGETVPRGSEGQEEKQANTIYTCIV